MNAMVRDIARASGRPAFRAWSYDEKKTLRDRREAKVPYLEIALMLGRSERSVRDQAYALGLPDIMMRSSEKRTEQVRTLAAAGRTAHQIRRELGMSKGVLAGIRKRSGIIIINSGSCRPPMTAEQRAAKRSTAQKRKAVSPEQAAKLPNLAIIERSFLIEDNLPPTDDPLSPKGCRWPIGEPCTPEFRYCQREQVSGPDGKRCAYCAQHRERSRAPTGAQGTKRLGKSASYFAGTNHRFQDSRRVFDEALDVLRVHGGS